MTERSSDFLDLPNSRYLLLPDFPDECRNSPILFPDEYKNCPALQGRLFHNNLLEELMFWTIKYEFPQQVVCLLLNMLPDLEYKVSVFKTLF